jgi:hypothetical protein
MSINYYPFFIRGIQISRDELNDYGIEDLWDDKWLPYIEGHPGTLIHIAMSNTGGGDVFIGWTQMDPYTWRDEWETQAVEINPPDKSVVIRELKKIGIQFKEEEVVDMLVGIHM